MKRLGEDLEDVVATVSAISMKVFRRQVEVDKDVKGLQFLERLKELN